MYEVVNDFIKVSQGNTNFSEDDLKKIIQATQNLFVEIRDLLPDRFPKQEIGEGELDLGTDTISHYYVGTWGRSIRLSIFNPNSFIYVSKKGISHDGYFVDAGNLYVFLKNKERIINFVKESKDRWDKVVDEEMKIISSVSSKKEPANSYFEKVFHNTGKTLKSVVKDMQGKGYSKSDIVSAILNVLGDVNWED